MTLGKGKYVWQGEVMSTSRLIITIDIDQANKDLSALTLEHLKLEQRSHNKALILKGLKRVVRAFNSLQVQEQRIDMRVFDKMMDFSDISFAVEDKVGGVWQRTDLVFGVNFEQDGYEIIN